jgi:hypothetical protein
VKIEALELELKSALLGTGLVQPVSSEARRAGAKWFSLEVLCRQTPGQEAPWLGVVDQVLSLTEAAPLSLHICRRYLRKNNRMVFGWHIGLSGSLTEVEAAVQAVVPVLVAARPELDGAAPAPARPPARAGGREAPEEGDGPEDAPEAGPARRSQPLAPGRHPPAKDVTPRPPGPPASGVTPPEGFIPRIRVVKNEVGADGKLRIIEEMPLPHVYREMNKPFDPDSTRGAFLAGDGDFHPAKTRRRR